MESVWREGAGAPTSSVKQREGRLRETAREQVAARGDEVQSQYLHPHLVHPFSSRAQAGWWALEHCSWPVSLPPIKRSGRRARPLQSSGGQRKGRGRGLWAPQGSNRATQWATLHNGLQGTPLNPPHPQGTHGRHGNDCRYIFVMAPPRL